jgi:hypothetical protein
MKFKLDFCLSDFSLAIVPCSFYRKIDEFASIYIPLD